MTVSSAVRKAGPFAGNNVAVTFPFSFKVFVKGDIKVLRANSSGAATELTLDSDYSVALNTDQNSQPGGWVTYPISGAPLPSGYSLVLLGDLLYDQETDLTNLGGFYPQTIEDMVDRATIQIQQLEEITSRAITIPEVESTSPVLPDAQARANGVLGFDASGGLEVMPLPAAIGAGDLKNELWKDGIDYIAGTSTSVQTSRVYATKANLGSVVMAGGGQAPDTYQLVGTTLTFLDDSGNPAAIPLGVEKIWCVGGTTLSVFKPAAGSVGPDELSINAVVDKNVDPNAAIQTSKLSFTAPVTGAPAQSVSQRLSQTLYASDFCALDGVTNDAAGLQALINTNKRIIIPYTSHGIRLDSPVTIGTGQIIEFENPSMVVKSITPSCIFRLTGYGDTSQSTSGIRGGCSFDMTGAPNTSTAIRFGTSSGVVWGVRVEDGRYCFYNCYEAIGDEASAANYTTDCTIGDTFYRYTKGRQIYSRRSRGFMRFEKTYIDQSANATTPTFECMRVEDHVGILLGDFDVSGAPTGLTDYQSTAIALVIHGTGQSGVLNSYVQANRILVDGTNGNGMFMDNCQNVTITKLNNYQNLGWGTEIQNCKNVKLLSSQFMGAVGVTGASVSQHGLELDNCDDVQLTALFADFNTGNGVLLNNTTHSQIQPWKARNNLNFGLVETGTSNSNAIVSGCSRGNTGGSISVSGAATLVDNFQQDSGAWTFGHVGALAL